MNYFSDFVIFGRKNPSRLVVYIEGTLMIKYKTVIAGFLDFTTPIPYFKNYVVDKDGNIYSRNHGKIIKPYLTKSGYATVSLYKNNIKYCKRVHRLVLETYIKKCPKGMEACHNNNIKADNKLENLRWDTHKNNCADRKNNIY